MQKIIKLFVFSLFALGSLTTLSSAQSNFSDFSKLYRQGKRVESKKGFESLKKSAAKNDSVWYYLGIIARGEENYEVACEYFEKAIEIKPKDSGYHLWLARSYGQDAQKASVFRQPFLAKNCKKAYEKSIELDKKQIDARVELISFHLQAPSIVGGSIEEAKVLAKELEPIDAYIALNQQFRIASNQSDKSVAQIISKGKTMFPDSVGFYLLDFYESVNQKKWDDAFAKINQSQNRFPSNWNLTYQMGRLAALSGKYLTEGELALSTFLSNSPKIESNPLKPHAHYRLGMIYEHMGNKEKALISYKQAGNLKQAQDAIKALK